MRVERNSADAPTTNPRPQFHIWWLMAAVYFVLTTDVLDLANWFMD